MLYLCSMEDFVDAMMEEYGIDLSASIGGGDGGYHVQADGKGGIVEVVWMPEFDFTPWAASILMHECIHVAVNSMQARRIPVIPEGSSEMLAYMASSIFYGLMEEMTHGCK